MSIAKETVKTIVGEQCVRCGSCVQICPKSALSFSHAGFETSLELNDRLCVECGLCLQHCPVTNPVRLRQPVSAYAAYSKKEEIRKTSASGGVFSVLAEEFLENGGIVYGAAMQKDWSVSQVKAERLEELKPLRGSKYVKSTSSDTYKQVKADLKAGKKVLYSGTPCLIAGLYSFLGNDVDGLFTTDVVCHGTPDSAVFQDYIRFREEKDGIRISELRFRDHTIKKDTFNGIIHYKKGNKEYVKPLLYQCDSYYYWFMHSKIYQQHCYSCPFACRKRTADITLGDFWGIETVFPDRKAGNISLVLVNSEKGDILLESSRGIEKFAVDTEAACKHNGQLNRPSQMPSEYEYFTRMFKEKGYGFLQEQFDKLPVRPKLLAKIAFHTPDYIKRLLK